MRWIFWTQWQCIVHHQVRRIWHQGQLLEHVFKPFKVTGALFLFLCMTTKSRPKEVCSWRQVAVRSIVTRSIDVSCGQSDQKCIVLQSARFSLTWRCSWSHVWADIWIFEELSYQFALWIWRTEWCWTVTSFHVGAAKIEERLGAGYAQGPSAQGHGVDLPVIGRFIVIFVGTCIKS